MARRSTLRVALLSMIEPAAAGTAPRAFLRVGGITIARQQLGLVLSLGAERIVCLAAGMVPEVIELQHAAERAGASFHLITNARALAGLVTAADELIALEDGLLVPGEQAAVVLERGHAVLAQPIEQGLEAGFERLDLNHASAGAIRIPGRLVERLADLPPDCDALSALQRIALQAGIAQTPIPAAGQRGPIWALVRSDAEAHAIEPLWIRLRTQDDAATGPSRWLALLGVRRLGPALLHAGSGATPLAAGAATLALLGLGAGWFGLIPLGLSLCGLGWVLRLATTSIARIEADEGGVLLAGLRRAGAYGWLIDGILIALAGWSVPVAGGQLGYERYFPAFMLIALLRLLSRSLGREWSGWMEDRGVLALLLALATSTAFAPEAIRGAAVLLALAGILLPRGDLRLTSP